MLSQVASLLPRKNISYKYACLLEIIYVMHFSISIFGYYKHRSLDSLIYIFIHFLKLCQGITGMCIGSTFTLGLATISHEEWGICIPLIMYKFPSSFLSFRSKPSFSDFCPKAVYSGPFFGFVLQVCMGFIFFSTFTFSIVCLIFVNVAIVGLHFMNFYPHTNYLVPPTNLALGFYVLFLFL